MKIHAVDQPDAPPIEMPDRFRRDIAYFMTPPGEGEVPAHGDFGALRRAALAQHVTVTGPISQGDFFTALGIHPRAESLAENATALEKTDIASALKRLCAPEQMGALFKVLAISSPGLAAPPAMGARSQGVFLKSDFGGMGGALSSSTP